MLHKDIVIAVILPLKSLLAQKTELKQGLALSAEQKKHGKSVLSDTHSAILLLLNSLHVQKQELSPVPVHAAEQQHLRA